MLPNKPKIAVLSGKGGTGKTLLAVNLAAASEHATYVDCDVEEPNGFLYFKPQAVQTEVVKVKVPVVDNKLCDGCRKCVDFCRFNALVYVKGKVKVFEEVCHACGGCLISCPTKALKEVDRDIGEVQSGISKSVKVHSGVMYPGETSGVPIIKSLFKKIESDELTIIDCPPGSGCAVMESIKEADYCLIVAEPTIFGLHNMLMVINLAQLFNKRYGVIINKVTDNDNVVRAYCDKNGLDIIDDIKYDKQIGLTHSNAVICSRVADEYKQLFANFLHTIQLKMSQEVSDETITNT